MHMVNNNIQTNYGVQTMIVSIKAPKACQETSPTLLPRLLTKQTIHAVESDLSSTTTADWRFQGRIFPFFNCSVLVNLYPLQPQSSTLGWKWSTLLSEEYHHAPIQQGEEWLIFCHFCVTSIITGATPCQRLSQTANWLQMHLHFDRAQASQTKSNTALATPSLTFPISYPTKQGAFTGTKKQQQKNKKQNIQSQSNNSSH